MTKIKYPQNGIYNIIKTDLDNCCLHLNNAVSNTNYTVPSTFSYKQFMIGLKSDLDRYSSEMNSLKNTIQSLSNEYENLELDMIDELKSINSFSVKERDRMIY